MYWANHGFIWFKILSMIQRKHGLQIILRWMKAIKVLSQDAESYCKFSQQFHKFGWTVTTCYFQHWSRGNCILSQLFCCPCCSSFTQIEAKHVQSTCDIFCLWFTRVKWRWLKTIYIFIMLLFLQARVKLYHRWPTI